MSSCRDGAEPAIETQITSVGLIPTAVSQPARPRCQIPAVAVPEARSRPGACRIAPSRSARVRQGASVRTKIAPASRLTRPTGAKSSWETLVIPRQCSVAISMVTSVIE
jgi:hypothetical protein